MSQNNTQKRRTILDECFSMRAGAFTWDKLRDSVKNKLGVKYSRETIFSDIKFIQETIEDHNFGKIDFEEEPVFIPKLYDGKKRIYKYTSQNLSLGNYLLSKSDQEQLEETLAILSRYRNRADFYWLDELFPRIETSFNIVHEDYSGLISYQNNRDYEGQTWVGKLYNQLLRKKVLLIEYKDFNSPDSYSRKIHPYHLKQYNNRWFLFGLEEIKNTTRITNLALDRIIEIKEKAENIKPNTIEWADYFDDIIGVTKYTYKEPQVIKLRFTKNRIKYILTKPIHGASQKKDKTDLEQRTITIKVIENNELYQTLLSFGNDVEVIEPSNIKARMKKITDEMSKLYNYF